MDVDLAPPRWISGRARDDERRRLAAADVATLRFGRTERREEAIKEVAGGALVRGEHRGPDGRALHHVRLDGDAVGCDVTGRLDASRARVRGGATRGIDDPDLANGLARVRGKKIGKHIGRSTAIAQPGEPVRAVGNLRERLCDHRADPGFDPRASGADERPAALDRDAEAAGHRIAGDDRIGHRRAS